MVKKQLIEEIELVPGISLEKRYELIREQIQHEDGLINQRLNWLLLSQGFLFAAFTTIIAGNNKSSSGTIVGPSGIMLSVVDMLVPLMVIAVAGLLLNAFSFVGLSDAYQSLKYLRENWHHSRPIDKKGQDLFDTFPHITWEGSAITTASSSPIVITAAWMSMLLWMLWYIPNRPIWDYVVMAIVVATCVGMVRWMYKRTVEGLSKRKEKINVSLKQST